MRVLAVAAFAIAVLAGPTTGVASADECGALGNGVCCGVVRHVFPPDGDIIVPVFGEVLDCPPYGE